MKNDLLRLIPSVDEILRDASVQAASGGVTAEVQTDAIRAALDLVRAKMLSGELTKFTRGEAIRLAAAHIEAVKRSAVRRVVNASGTILHTNTGRAVLPAVAVQSLIAATQGNVNLEYDIDAGGRGERDSLVEPIIKRLTGAAAACVVNNNAAAVLITLNTLAEDKDVVVSRGELIEIGGSFRLPDIINKSGCRLLEVGTTNRTHLADYEKAVSADTGVLFKAHTSNYKVIGFTSAVPLNALAGIGRNYGVPVVEDLGSGSLIDLSAYGFSGEPTVRQSIESGADIVTFSADKLLGGPQAGIIAGKEELIGRIRKNPLKRVLRVDKLTLAALEATLLLYNDVASLRRTLPTLRYLTRDVAEINDIAAAAVGLLKARLGEGYVVEIVDAESEAGAGSLPGQVIKTKAVSITHAKFSADVIFKHFLSGETPILGRVNKDRFLLDMRTIESPGDVVPDKRI